MMNPCSVSLVVGEHQPICQGPRAVITSLMLPLPPYSIPPSFLPPTSLHLPFLLHLPSLLTPFHLPPSFLLPPYHPPSFFQPPPSFRKEGRWSPLPRLHQQLLLSIPSVDFLTIFSYFPFSFDLPLPSCGSFLYFNLWLLLSRVQ